MSLWERHKANIYRYGHIYATIFGLSVINYIPGHTDGGWTQRLARVYGHAFSLMLIVALPVYFAWNVDVLLSAADRRLELLLVVTSVSTFIKYLTVILTYGANNAYYSAIREITRTRQQLENELEALPIEGGHSAPRRQFEHFLLFKFALINAMMLVQGANIWLLRRMDAPAVRVQYACYAFVLWNYTENMANYFYFMNCSIMKFYRELNEQLAAMVAEAKRLQRQQCAAQRRQRRRRGRPGGVLMERCNGLCDRLDAHTWRFCRIHKLYADSVTMHELQILGILLTALVSNLTNFFTLFNLFFKQSGLDADALLAIVLSVAHAGIFYIDTSIVTQVGDLICVAQHELGRTAARFNGIRTLDARLDQAIENFALKLLQLKAEFRICGFFNLDKQLTFLIASASFTYFITLVQFDLNLNGLT